MQREEGTDPENVYMTKFIYEGPLGKGEFQNYEIALLHSYELPREKICLILQIRFCNFY